MQPCESRNDRCEYRHRLPGLQSFMIAQMVAERAPGKPLEHETDSTIGERCQVDELSQPPSRYCRKRPDLAFDRSRIRVWSEYLQRHAAARSHAARLLPFRTRTAPGPSVSEVDVGPAARPEFSHDPVARNHRQWLRLTPFEARGAAQARARHFRSSFFALPHLAIVTRQSDSAT